MRAQHAEERYRKHLFKKKENQKLYDAALAEYKHKTQLAATTGTPDTGGQEAIRSRTPCQSTTKAI